jgi:hypothetical protein
MRSKPNIVNDPIPSIALADAEQRKTIDPDRAAIKAWAREAWKHSGLSQFELAERLHRSGSRFAQLVSPRMSAALGPRAAERLARFAGVTLPAAIRQCCEASQQGKGWPSVTVVSAQLPHAGTAEGEIGDLVSMAHGKGPHVQRKIDMMRRRFGTGAAKAETLEEIGQSCGLTRERGHLPHLRR